MNVNCVYHVRVFFLKKLQCFDGFMVSFKISDKAFQCSLPENDPVKATAYILDWKVGINA